MTKTTNRLIAGIIACVMIISAIPLSAFATIPNWAENNVVYDGTTFGTNGYYNVISKKDYVLVPGAAVESEIVLNNAAGTRRQVLHVIEVDPSNPDVSIVPGYYQIDKIAEDPLNEANWSHKELTEMAKYYENNLGYNIVGGMNTDLYYNSYSPRVLVYNGQSIGNFGKDVSSDGSAFNATSSILYVFKDAEGNISCDVKTFNKTEYDSYLEEGILLHAVGVSFAMVVKDGKLVNTTEKRGNDDAARSMVGVKEDGTLVICMNDGRGANNSVGFSSYEEGEAMLALGCKWAANCDGGGSSTFLTKRVGEEDFTMRSVPCDGAQRPTAHGIFVASNVAPTGILDVVNVESEYDIFAPGTEYTFGAEAIDTHGYAMAMPADATWALSDASFGTIANGLFVSNGTKGAVDVQVISDGKVVGSKTITVADPEVFKLSATSTVVPYSTADKVRTIVLPIVSMTGEANVYVDTNVVSVSLSNESAGTLDGFMFTSTSDESIAGVDVTVTYGETELVYAIEFGKGSEILFDFEDGDKAGFMGFEEAKQWSIENEINNTLVGSDPLAGQFSDNVRGETFVSSNTNGGQVRNGNYALAWRLDNTDADFAGWTYNVLFNISDEVIVLRDVANGMKATTLGMWLYIPENAFPSAIVGGESNTGKGLAFQSQLYVKNADGSYSCKQDHFMFTSVATGKQTNLNSATNADIPESRWVYVTIDISKYDYLCMPVATDISNSRSPSFVRTYVKPDTADVVTFYIDDITLDYSSAVDDRILPTITAPTYSTSDTAVTLENGTVVNGNNVAFSATVADNAALDLASGKITVDGVAVEASINGSMLFTNGDVILGAGQHTVAFEVKDELGNSMKITRTFTVSGETVVALSGHNDNEPDEAPKAQSIYYVDINVADLANVDKLVAVLKLNNANKWETKGAEVAFGYSATYEYNEISELLTVKVEKTGTDSKSLDQTLVSIPVRVWTYDRYSTVTGKDYTVAEMGNKPVVNIDVEVVYGLINDKDSFAGSISVATELTTISSPYHVHDAELTILNREAAFGVAGYENRTYCETCKSVVDWGTVIPAIVITHNYEIVDGQFVCSDEGCGEVYECGTGLFEMNGKTYYAIAGNLVTKWQLLEDGFYYYFDPATYAAVNGTFTSYEVANTSQYFTYSFIDGKLENGAWVKMDGGTRYYYGPSYYHNTTTEINGETYSFRPDGYRYEGICVIKYNPKGNYELYEFTDDGIFVGNLYESGIYTVSDGSVYYLTNGIASSPGLVKGNDGYYYYFDSYDCKGARNTTCYVKVTNGLLPEGWCSFDDAGRMLIKQGVVHDEDGEIRYYVDGVATYAGLVKDTDGSYYYISGNGCIAIKNCKKYISFTNGLLPAGNYEFGEDGKLLIKQGVVKDPDGKIRYYVDGVATYAGLVKDTDGSYYYISGNGCTAITNCKKYISFTNGLLPAGNYEFGEDGKLLIKQGVVRDLDGKIRYYVNGVATTPGLVQDNDGYYYYISGNGGVAITDKTYYVSESKTNGLLPAGNYQFGADGKMNIKQGVVLDADGKIRYYVNGVATIPGLVQDREGNYYYISGNGGIAIIDRTYYVSESKANGLLPAGNYIFGADGKMIID